MGGGKSREKPLAGISGCIKWQKLTVLSVQKKQVWEPELPGHAGTIHEPPTLLHLEENLTKQSKRHSIAPLTAGEKILSKLNSYVPDDLPKGTEGVQEQARSPYCSNAQPLAACIGLSPKPA